MSEGSHKNFYITPEEFILAVSDALRNTYYEGEEWFETHHPEDLGSNLAVIAESSGAFMGSLIAMRSKNTYAKNPDYEKIWDRINQAIINIDHENQTVTMDYTQANDAYVDTEADGNDAA
jgi:hypothetical protein